MWQLSLTPCVPTCPGFQFLHSPPNTCHSSVWVTAALEGVRRHFTVAVLLRFKVRLTRLFPVGSMLQGREAPAPSRAAATGQGWTCAGVTIHPACIHSACRPLFLPAPTSHPRRCFFPAPPPPLPEGWPDILPASASHNLLFKLSKCLPTAKPHSHPADLQNQWWLQAPPHPDVSSGPARTPGRGSERHSPPKALRACLPCWGECCAHSPRRGWAPSGATQGSL